MPLTCTRGCTRNSDDQRIPALTEPPSLICSRCEENLKQWLDEIPDLYERLPLYINHGTIDKTQGVTKAVDAQAPMRLEIIDLLDTRRGRHWNGLTPTEDRRGVLGTLHAYAQWIRDDRHLTPLAAAPTVVSETRLLNKHRLWIAEQDLVNDFYDELRTVHRQLNDALGERRPRPVGTCIVDTDHGPCGGPLLPSQQGGVHCPRCGDTWNHDELRRLGLLIGDNT